MLDKSNNLRNHSNMSETDYELPTPDKLIGHCPRCNLNAHFRFSGSAQCLQTEDFTTSTGSVIARWKEALSVLTCGGCNGGLIVISRNDWGADGTLFTSPIFYYPLPGVGRLGSSVPIPVASCFEEGVIALSSGCFRAAVVMFRGAIAEFVNDKGSDSAKSQKDLYHRLEVMGAEGSLHKSLIDWTTLIREIGNAGAHTEKYENVTKEQAESVENLTRMLIKLEYEIPAEVLRVKPASRTI